VAVASAGPYANKLLLAPDREPCQHPPLSFYRPDALPAAQQRHFVNILLLTHFLTYLLFSVHSNPLMTHDKATCSESPGNNEQHTRDTKKHGTHESPKLGEEFADGAANKRTESKRAGSASSGSGATERRVGTHTL